MPVSGWQTVLISASLAASCLGVSGQGIDVQLQRSHLLFLKSSPAGEPFNLELVAYTPNGTYLFGVDLRPATPAGATLQTIQGLATDYDGLYVFSYGVYSTSVIPRLIVTDINSPNKTVVFHESLPLPSGCQLDTSSDPPLAVGPGINYNSYTVYAILLCGNSFTQYLGQFGYEAPSSGPPYRKLMYLKRTAVSPVTHGPQRQPQAVISQIFYVDGTLHANAVGTSVHLKQYFQILRFPLRLGRFEVAYSAPPDQCAVTISSARRVYALCYEASAGFESEVKIITSGRPSKVIRPINPGMEFVGLATHVDSPYVYLIHVDEIATNGKGGPDTVEVISKETGRTVYTWKVLRVYTAAWPVVAS